MSGAAPETGIGEVLRAVAADQPDAVFLRDGGSEVTFAALDARVDAVAAGLRAHGVRPGDRVAIAAPNCPEWLEVLFATARLGAVLVTLNVRYREAELEYMLGQSGARVLITSARVGEFDFVAFYRGFADRIPSVERIFFLGVDGEQGYGSLGVPGGSVGDAVEASSAAVILYTSGTTGRPKGAALTHASLLASAAAQVERTGLTSADISLAVMPFNHVGGLTCTVLASLLAGARVVLQPAFSPAAALGAMRAEGVTTFGGVPTMWTLILDELGAAGTLGALRLALIGGSNAEPALCRRILAAAPGARLSNLYGLSESSGAAVMSEPQDSIETVCSTLGTALAGVEARVVDLDGEVVEDGRDGELQIRGPVVAAGYWDMPVATEETFGGGWLRTGDVVRRRSSGHFELRGRLKEMFIQGGYNVYPVEVENVLGEHPAVSAAAGIGVPDPVHGEVGHYFVRVAPGVSRPDAEELKAFCAQRLAGYKVPRFIEFVEEFPLTPAGKIHKVVLRERVRGR